MSEKLFTVNLPEAVTHYPVSVDIGLVRGSGYKDFLEARDICAIECSLLTSRGWSNGAECSGIDDSQKGEARISDASGLQYFRKNAKCLAK